MCTFSCILWLCIAAIWKTPKLKSLLINLCNRKSLRKSHQNDLSNIAQYYYHRHAWCRKDHTLRESCWTNWTASHLGQPSCEGQGMPWGMERWVSQPDGGRRQGMSLYSEKWRINTVSFFGWRERHKLILLQLLDAIEDDVKAGGCIIDWHACDLFPKSWIDLVVVLRVDSSTHYDRLAARYVSSIMNVVQPVGCGFKQGI